MNILFFVSFILLMLGGIAVIVSSINMGVLSEYNKTNSKEYKISKIIFVVGVIMVALVIMVIILKLNF